MKEIHEHLNIFCRVTMKTGKNLTLGKRCLLLILLTLTWVLLQAAPVPSQGLADPLAAKLESINQAIQARGGSWVAGETSVSRLSLLEKRRLLGLIKPTPEEEVEEESVSVYPPLVGLPTSLDWRNNGGNFVTSVRNQGNCGSCWAFATTAALESATLIYNQSSGVDLNLAEQILLSCSGAGTCEEGGYINTAASYIQSTGLPVESCYPYTVQNGICTKACANWTSSAYRIASWSWVATTSPTVDALKNALATKGPLVTTLDVYEDFYDYLGGVYAYAKGVLLGGHAVLLVGYDDPGRYFIVKNSWGPWWGESGYFRIAYSEVNGKVRFGDWTIAYGNAIPPNSETVSSPTVLSGPANGSVGVTYTFMTGGSSSSLGHSIQYIFDWGDSTTSGWLPVGTTSAIKSWTSQGTYLVKAQARCATHNAAVSSWSTPLSVPLLCSSPGIPSNPSPVSGATGISTSTTLGWTCSGASSYDFYFGTLSNPPYVGTTASPQYSRTGLVPRTTYYWKVIAKNSCGSTTGAVWSFNTTEEGYSSVTVLAPNGGETVPAGSTYTISWGAPSQAVKFNLEYSMDGGITWKVIASGVAGTTYAWTAPVPKKPQKRCRVRVTGFDSNGTKIGEDRSDANFTIQGVRITSPGGGTTLLSGTTSSIVWETLGAYGTVAHTRIYHSRDGGQSWSLVTSLAGNPGRYDWLVPSPKAMRRNCRLRVELRDSKGNILAFDTNADSFAIQPPAL